jgi:hypothetical protein
MSTIDKYFPKMAHKKAGDTNNKRLRSALTPEESEKSELSMTNIKGLMLDLFESNGLLDLANDVKEIKDMKKHLIDLQTSLEFSQQQWEESKQTMTQNKNEIDNLKKKVSALENELKHEKEKGVKLEMAQKDYVLIFHGIEESDMEPRELCYNKIQTTLKDILEVENADIDVCNRMGRRLENTQARKNIKKRTDKPRPIWVKFTRQKDRNQVWSQRRKLSGTNIILREALTQDMEKNIQTLLPIMRQAKEMGKKANMVRDKLYIDDKRYDMTNLKELPVDLQPENLSTKITPKEVFFWGQNAPLSNFYQANFIEGPNTYVCVEQYYAYERAKLFEDTEAQVKIMSSTNPITHKKTRVKGFKQQQWNQISKSIMQKGIELKFTQNYDLKQYLIDTKNRELIETNPHDSYWGIGLTLKEALNNNRSAWGENWLGKILMEVRSKLG